MQCLESLCIAILNSTTKTPYLPYYAYVFSSTKLVIRAEQVLPGSDGGKRGIGEGRGAGGRNGPMYAHVNK
jgi:hypothetical protein